MSTWLQSIIVIILVLLLARVIKRNTKIFQRYFIPSSLIGGFGALLLGPQVIGVIPADIVSEWRVYPSLLINIVFAGLFLGHTIPKPREIWQKSAPMLAFGNTLAWGQYVVGILLTIFILGPIFSAPPATGALIEISFEGGHGTAAGLAPTFTKLGWSAGTDLALGIATASIVAAIFIGIFIINVHYKRRGKILDEAAMRSQQQRLIRNGYSLTKFTNRLETNPKELFITIVLFATSIGLGYIMLHGLMQVEDLALGSMTSIRLFKYLPLFPMAMIGGLIVQFILNKVHKSYLVQKNTIKVVSAIALDLLIVSAIASLSLNVIYNNFAIFIILTIAGIAWILGSYLFFAPRFFRRNWFENGITNTAQSMGMTATGLLINRLADPNNRTHAREAFAYKQLAFEPFMGGGIVTAAAAIMMSELGLWPMLVISTIILAIWISLGLKLGQSPHKTHQYENRVKLLGKIASRK